VRDWRERIGLREESVMEEKELYPTDEQGNAPLADVPDEVPEADAVEQAQPVVDDDDGTDRIDERPEADALDQDRHVDPQGDDERR
jgi:hypothetical protein